jgi:hypothetical protein
VAAGLAVLIAVLSFWMFRTGHWAGRPRMDLSGNWSGTVRPEGGRPFRLAMNLLQKGESLSGTVEFPTGTGRIVEGQVKGGRVRFLTTHVPDFDTREVTTVFEGVGSGRELRFEMRYDGTVRSFVVQRQ